MEDLGCPRCKTTQYRKASLKLLVNVCGHALCDSCVELLFSKGSGLCPECQIPLRRQAFRIQLFEDPAVEKEVDIRRRILRDYCKTETDFDTLLEFNDYLEEIEHIVFNLCNNVDVLETNRRIEQYKKDNREQIAHARASINPEVLKLEAILEEERLMAEHRLFETQTLEKEEKKRKVKTKEDLIDDLMFSETDAQSILASHKLLKEQREEQNHAVEEELARKRLEILAETTSRLNLIKQGDRPQFSSGITAGASGGFLPIPKRAEEPLFVYEEPEVTNNGPIAPSYEELREQGRARFQSRQPPFGRLVRDPTIAERTGGYHEVLEVRRSLMDSFADLCFNPKIEAGIKNFPYENETGQGPSSSFGTYAEEDEMQ